MFSLGIGKSIVNSLWIYEIHEKGKMSLIDCGKDYKTAEAALEAGSKKLLELLPKETFDFGQGPVAAHKHQNGGGWVADTAHVSDTVYVGPNARVFKNARVYGDVSIDGNAKVYGHAEVAGYAYIYDNACVHGDARVFEFAQIYGYTNIDSGIICGYKHLNASDEKCVLVSAVGLECIGPFNSPGEASKAMLPGRSYRIRRLNKP